MSIVEIIKKIKEGSLTCSEVAEILADQKNSGGVSHLHMHMRDGFAAYVKRLFVEDSDGARRHYEEAHMTSPERVTKTGKVPVYDPKSLPPTDRFALDSGMMAKAEPGPSARSKYDYRSGRAEVPEVPESGKLVPHVLRVQPKAKPLDVPIEDELPSIPVTGLQGTDPGEFKEVVKNHGVASFKSAKSGDLVPGEKGLAKVKYVYVRLQARVPRLPGSEKHTMFEDSESMVMHLTAALRSPAALHMLEVLRDKNLGDGTTVGVFSKTAIWQVQEHVSRISLAKKAPLPAPKVIERKTNIDTTVAPSQANPNPVLDTFSYTDKDIDHIVLVMGRRLDGSLNIVTLFPSPDATMATIGVSNSPELDIEEPKFGERQTAVPMDKDYKALNW